MIERTVHSLAKIPVLLHFMFESQEYSFRFDLIGTLFSIFFIKDAALEDNIYCGISISQIYIIRLRFNEKRFA